jgi:hypothetical protein
MCSCKGEYYEFTEGAERSKRNFPAEKIAEKDPEKKLFPGQD